MDIKSYDAYIKSIDFKKVTIYGLSSRARACLNWFNKYYFNTEIIGFIPDSQTDL